MVKAHDVHPHDQAAPAPESRVMRLDILLAALDATVVPFGKHSMAGGVDGDLVEMPDHADDCAGGIITKTLQRLDRLV